MEAILLIDGWVKKTEITIDILNKRVLFIDETELPLKKDTTPKVVRTLMFEYTGRKVRNRPVFKYNK